MIEYHKGVVYANIIIGFSNTKKKIRILFMYVSYTYLHQNCKSHLDIMFVLFICEPSLIFSPHYVNGIKRQNYDDDINETTIARISIAKNNPASTLVQVVKNKNSPLLLWCDSSSFLKNCFSE